MKIDDKKPYQYSAFQKNFPFQTSHKAFNPFAFTPDQSGFIVLEKEFSDIQVANLLLLQLIRSYAHTDLTTACCCFGLSVEQINFITKMTLSDILLHICHIDDCLFRPRADLSKLFSKPAPLAGVFLLTQRN